MKIKVTLLLWIVFGMVQVKAMEKASQMPPLDDESTNLAVLPDEVVVRIMYHVAESGTIIENEDGSESSIQFPSIADACKKVAALRLINKRFSRLSTDVVLMKKILISHVADEDYNSTLSNILSRACRFGQNFVVIALNHVPASQTLFIRSEDWFDPHCFEDSGDDNSENRVPASQTLLLSPEEEDSGDDNSDSDCIEEGMSFLKARINTIDKWGYFPLLHAAEGGRFELVKLLLEHGAQVNFQNQDKDTALLVAVRRGHQEIVDHLLTLKEIKEGINLKGFGEESAFLVAAKLCLYANDEQKEDLYLTMLIALAKHRADVNTTDGAHLSAMDWAAKMGKIKLINVLLDCKVNLTKQHRIGLDIFLLEKRINKDREWLLEKIKKIENSRVKMGEIVLELKNKPYTLSFEVNNNIYAIEVANASLNKKFAQIIIQLDQEILSRVGQKIVNEVRRTGSAPNSIVINCSYDMNDYRLAFELLFGLILYQPYYWAKKKANHVSMQKIREIVIPIFNAYPHKNDSVYGTFWEKYDLK